MSEHLTPEALWEAARVPPEGDDYAHLQLCPDCRLELGNIKLAQSALVEPPGPAPLSDDSAKRIGNVLRKAAEKQARRAQWYGAWWPFNFSPNWVLAPAAAALMAFFAYRAIGPVPGEPQPSPIAKRDAPATPTPPPMNEAPQALPAKKVLAQVKSTKNARSGSGALKQSQQVSEGSTVATAKGGSLIMALPDGSQIGLDGSSQVQLAKLEDRAVTLDVDRGSMKVLARHDPSRELKVRAGELEIFDVGTEFIVSRDADHTLVGVQEGEVEVRAPGGEKVPVRAGQAVEYCGGKLERQQWAQADELPRPRPPAPPRRTEPQAAKRPSADETPEIPSEPQAVSPPVAQPAEPARVEPAKQPEVATNEPEHASSPDEWGTPSNLKDAPVLQPPPVPAPQPPEVQPPPQAPTAARDTGPTTSEEEDTSLKARIEREVNRIKNAFRPASRLQRADEIVRLVERRQCTDALAQADAWLTEAVPRGESFNLRRSVLSSKLRCLNFEGRSGDAAAVQRELDKL
ncbi:MAG: FecR domain-containing protein [Archangiaceae bacterium]|nr:FecR domain-containing protein [Archangiaceae bacterium]